MTSPNSHTAHATAVYDLERLRQGITPMRLHYFPRLGSTSTHAARMRREGRLFAPAIVLTAKQTAGRGRGANQWFSSDGSLTVTFVFPTDEQVPPQHVPLLAGLAVRHATAELTGNPGIGLKWPNDLYHDGRKLAGLLCERLDKIDLIGLGLNVNLDPASAPDALRGRVTSLQAISAKALNIDDVLIAIAQRLSQTLRDAAQQPFSQTLREYDAHHVLVGRTVTVIQGGVDPDLHGVVEGLDDTGRLLVLCEGKLHPVIAGHVECQW